MFLTSPCRIRERLLNVFSLEVGEGLENLERSLSTCDETHHHPDRYAETPNAGLSAHHLGIKSDSVKGEGHREINLAVAAPEDQTSQRGSEWFVHGDAR